MAQPKASTYKEYACGGELWIAMTNWLRFKLPDLGLDLNLNFIAQ